MAQFTFAAQRHLAVAELGQKVPEGDIPGRSEHPELGGRTRIEA
jgi:hypothetical protein